LFGACNILKVEKEKGGYRVSLIFHMLILT
jgi:hypothetical protein